MMMRTSWQSQGVYDLACLSTASLAGVEVISILAFVALSQNNVGRSSSWADLRCEGRTDMKIVLVMLLAAPFLPMLRLFGLGATSFDLAKEG